MTLLHDLTETLHSLSETFEELIETPGAHEAKKNWLFETSSSTLAACEARRANLTEAESELESSVMPRLHHAEARLVQAMARFRLREHRDQIKDQLKSTSFFSSFFGLN